MIFRFLPFQVNVVPMKPDEAAAEALNNGFAGLTVFVAGALNLWPGMDLEDLAMLAADALQP